MSGEIKLVINQDDMTFGELVEFEEVAGMSMDQMAKGEMSAKALLALVWISKKRDDPKFTLEEAKLLRVADVDFSGDPTQPAELEPLAKPATRRARKNS